MVKTVKNSVTRVSRSAVPSPMYFLYLLSCSSVHAGVIVVSVSTYV